MTTVKLPEVAGFLVVLMLEFIILYDLDKSNVIPCYTYLLRMNYASNINAEIYLMLSNEKTKIELIQVDYRLIPTVYTKFP